MDCQRQARTGLTPDPPPPAAATGVYLHFPFCSIRCSYCDFATVAGRDDRIPVYLDALHEEIASCRREVPDPVDTIFLGGGTPSRMTAAQVEAVLDRVRGRFRVDPDCEITLEANPENLTPEGLDGFLRAGVNRVSVGVQSLDDEVLERVGRAHDGARALSAIEAAVAAGFRSVNADLILGLPGERLDRWASTVTRVAGLGVDHVSVYLLETDKDTPLGRAVRRGRTALAEDRQLAEAYGQTVKVLDEHGLGLYEISNFARPRHRSRHNLKYWTDAPYGGFGLGAHSYYGGRREANRRDLGGYLDDLAAGREPCAERDPWHPTRRVEEALVLGLRVSEGVDLEVLGRRYRTDLVERHRDAWERGEEAGLIVRDGARVRLTAAGRLASNELFVELISGD